MLIILGSPPTDFFTGALWVCQCLLQHLCFGSHLVLLMRYAVRALRSSIEDLVLMRTKLLKGYSFNTKGLIFPNLIILLLNPAPDCIAEGTREKAV